MIRLPFLSIPHSVLIQFILNFLHKLAILNQAINDLVVSHTILCLLALFLIGSLDLFGRGSNFEIVLVYFICQLSFWAEIFTIEFWEFEFQLFVLTLPQNAIEGEVQPLLQFPLGVQQDLLIFVENLEVVRLYWLVF